MRVNVTVACKVSQQCNAHNQMTITERNQQLFELREMLTKKEQEIAWIKQNIWLVNEMYDRENRETPLFEEMFGG